MLISCYPAAGGCRVTEIAIGTPLAGCSTRTRRRKPGWSADTTEAGCGRPDARLTLDNSSLRPLGAAIGAGVLAALPADRCGVAETARVVSYLAAESAGQCGPCLNGLPRIAATLAELAGPRPRRGARGDVERWAALVNRRGACSPPGRHRALRPQRLAGLRAGVPPA